MICSRLKLLLREDRKVDGEAEGFICQINKAGVGQPVYRQRLNLIVVGACDLDFCDRVAPVVDIGCQIAYTVGAAVDVDIALTVNTG